MNRILISDGTNLYHRNYWVCKAKNNKNYLEFILNKTISLKSFYKDSRIIFAFDTCKSERKLKFFPEYKANRLKNKSRLTDEEHEEFNCIYLQFIELMKLSGCTVLEGHGFEADDYIATIAQMLKPRYEVTITSTDQDFYQLVNKNIKIYDPLKNITITVDNFKNVTEIKSEYFLDYKCMIGDIGDNISGIPDIGPKTAIKMISLYGDYQNIVKNLKIKDKLTYRETVIINSKDIYEKNKVLIDLSLNYSDIRLKGIIKDFVNKTSFEKKALQMKLAEHDLMNLYEEISKLCLKN